MNEVLRLELVKAQQLSVDLQTQNQKLIEELTALRQELGEQVRLVGELEERSRAQKNQLIRCNEQLSRELDAARNDWERIKVERDDFRQKYVEASGGLVAHNFTAAAEHVEELEIERDNLAEMASLLKAQSGARLNRLAREVKERCRLQAELDRLKADNERAAEGVDAAWAGSSKE